MSIKISILQGTESRSIVYTERHTPNTNANGLATLSIGAGTVLNGGFSNINWANGPYFIKTETDPNGGNNYTISSSQQLLSVPYALYSGNGISRISSTGDTLYLGNGSSIIIPGISGANEIGQTGLTQHTCGNENVHNPSKTYGSMTDQEGNVYKTVVIGTQEWMAENLNTSHYRNGDLIPNIIDNTQWTGLTTGAWAYYLNDSQYECPHGKLYNWFATADSRNICPTGWHVPTDLEWSNLINFLGGEVLAGGKMKTTGLQYWYSPNQAATNASGFSGLPSGILFATYDGQFWDFGGSGYWWSSTENSSTDARFRNLDYDNGNAYSFSFGDGKQNGFSVRCLKD